MAPKIAVVYVSTHPTCPSYLVYISRNETSLNPGHIPLLHTHAHNVLK